MLDSIKRWLGPGRASRRDWPAQAAWAQSNGWQLRGVRDAEGFVIDGRCGTLAWRLEWGPSQRSYIAGNELRLRAELEVPRELQALVLDRVLMESMERAVFDEYVEDVQTRIDTGTPAEMRWLVMLNKASGTELGALREGFAAVSSSRPWMACWVEGALAPALLDAPRAPGQPLVLTLARGRLTLRTALEAPTPEMLDAWLRIFGTALRELRRAAEQSAAAPPSTQASDWEAGSSRVEGGPSGQTEPADHPEAGHPPSDEAR